MAAQTCTFLTELCTLLKMIFWMFNISCQDTNGGSPFVETYSSHFVLDGNTFVFNGFNAYWMMTVASNPSERFKVSQVFKEASQAGLTVARTWAFSDGGNNGALQASPGVYNEQVFQALDFVVSEARKYGIRLILSLVNNYKDYGGRPQYAQWARSAGAQIQNDDDFYTNPVIRGYYKNHVKKIVTRFNTVTKIVYKDDPTIMAWELINEPRCESDTSGKTINGWIQEMAPFVKSQDDKHLVGVGMEGFYGPGQRQQFNPGGYLIGTDFIGAHLVKEVDFASLHAYPDAWLAGKSEQEQSAFMGTWLFDHWTQAKTLLKKPLILGEFGKSSKDPGYTLQKRDAFFGDVYTNISRYAQSSGGAMSGGLVWQLMVEGMDPFHDGYQIILSQNPSTAAVISKQSQTLNQLFNI